MKSRIREYHRERISKYNSRSEERGLAAVKELEGEGLKPVFHQLDLADEASVLRLRYRDRGIYFPFAF